MEVDNNLVDIASGKTLWPLCEVDNKLAFLTITIDNNIKTASYDKSNIYNY